ncbi:hypothetical protein [Legionella sp. CNM-4043-24]|uniref:hypothetical protein n=1 Tax=Legionella sp. CNM-4043-24 TaxID=3421646 RepID=UPI00403A8552
MFSYWEGILGVSDEVFTECENTFEKIKNGAFKGIKLKKLKGHNLWSARTGSGRARGRCRLLFTVIELGGKEYLHFIEKSNDHYRSSKVMRNPKALERFREHAGTQLAATSAASSSADDAARSDWEDVKSAERFRALKRHKTRQAIPMQWYADRPMVLDEAQRSGSKLQLPILFTGLPGSGKTSTMLLRLPAIRAYYPRIVCITRSSMLRNDLQSAWNAMPQALDPGGLVEFLTYREWAESCGLDMSTRTEAGEEEFITWYLEHAASFAKRFGYEKRPTLLERPAGRDRDARERHRREKARTVYQEGRIASGCLNKAAYLSLGKRLSILEPESLDRRFVWDIIEQGWLPTLDSRRQVDLSFLRLEPKVCGGVVWADEAQDLSGAQLENIAKFAGPELPLVLCAGDFQRLNDALPFTKPIRNLAYANGRNGNVQMTHISLPGSYRVPLVLEPFMQRIITLAINDLGGLQDKRQVHEFKCSQGRHARPGKAHWLTWETMAEPIRDNLKALATDNPQCVIITHEEYKPEAEARFGEGAMVRTIAEVKGMQFETCILYRYLDTARFAGISEGLSREQSSSSSSTAVHRPKQGLGKWENATAFNRLFTACSRVSETLVLIDSDRPCHPTVALTTVLKQTLPEGSAPEFTRARQVFGAEEWLVCVEQYIRNDNIDHARAIFMRRCHGTNEAFDAFLERCQARVMPVLPKTAPAVPEMIPEIPQVPVAARSSDPVSDSACSAGPSFFKKGPRAKTSQTVIKTAQRTLVDAEARQRALEIFSPGNAERMLEFVSRPDTVSELRSYLLTPFNVLPFITARQFGMQFSKDPKKQYGTSLLYWFFKLGDRRHHNFLLEILGCNPGLLNELRQLFKKMTLSYDPAYNPGFADLCHAICNHGMPLDESRVLSLLMDKHSRMSRDEFLWAAARHVPKECHVFFRTMLRQSEEWETLSDKMRDRQSFWLEQPMVFFKQKYDDASKKAEYHRDKDYKKRVLEAFQTVCFGEVDQGVSFVFSKLKQTLEKKTVRNVKDMVGILNGILSDDAATPFNIGYLFLAAIRDTVVSQELSLLPAKNKRGVAGALQPPLGTMEQKFKDAATFWQYADVQTKHGYTLLYRFMVDKKASHFVLDAFKSLPELTTGMLLIPLLKDQAPTLVFGASSLLAWLCEGPEEGHQIVYDLLVKKNPMLSLLVCRALKDHVFSGSFKAGIFDLALLTKLEKTTAGKEVLKELSFSLLCSPEFLLQKLHEYLPKQWICEIRNAWENHQGNWEAYFKRKDMESRGGVLFQQVLSRVKERFQQVESYAAKKWTAVDCDNLLSLQTRVCTDLDRYKNSYHPPERGEIESVIARLSTLRPFSLPDVHRIFREALRENDISPFSYLAGYMRDFCIRFDRDVQNLEYLLDCDSRDFWERFQEIEWSSVVAKEFACSDACFIENVKTKAGKILQEAVSEGIMDETLLALNPKAVYMAFFQKVMDSLPTDSADRSHMERLRIVLNQQEDGKPIVELFQDVYSVFPENAYPKVGFLSELLRAVCLHAEAVMEAGYASSSPAASSMP